MESLQPTVTLQRQTIKNKPYHLEIEAVLVDLGVQFEKERRVHQERCEHNSCQQISISKSTLNARTRS